jgi:hypothetical protein
LRWRDHTCPHCGWRYHELRTGRTWNDVRRELRAEPERKRVSRGTILGRWHEFKRQLWESVHGPGRCIPET